MAETKVEQSLRYLQNSHASELGGVESMKDLAGETTDPEVKQVMEQYMALAQSHADRVGARISALGGDVSQPKSAVNSILAKTSHLANILHNKEDKQTQDTIKMASYAYFEVGAYTSLEAYSKAIGDTETAQLAQSLISDEKQMGERLLGLIPQLAAAAVSNASNA